MRSASLASNKIAADAGWDEQILAIEFQHLAILNIDFDVSLTGFELPAIDLIIQNAAKAATDEEEEEVAIDTAAAIITKLGDLWQLGNHQIFCGNALDDASYATVMAGEKAQMVFTDPPYNVPISGHVSGLGKVQHAEFAMASGEMSAAEFTVFLSNIFTLLAQYSIDGSIHYHCMDWRHIDELLTAGKTAYAELKNLCVWRKSNGGMGSLYRSQHELVFVFKNGTAPHINNVELGKHGRYRTNVWDYAGQNALHAKRDAELALHPTVKPVAMVADAILDCSHRGGLILDPFGGSGTTLIAAEKTGRYARLIELEPRYVDVTIRRWQQLTGKQAMHTKTGTFFPKNTTSSTPTTGA